MRTSSCKAKGRRLQDKVRDYLRLFGKQFGLVDDDIKSAIMGTTGVDIVLSPAAKAVLPLDIECKNREKLNVTTTFFKHYEKYAQKPTLKLLISSRNHQEPLVTLRWEDFIQLYEQAKENDRLKSEEK